MKKWLGRIRGALGMGLAWALGWAITGVLIGLASIAFPGAIWDHFFKIFDAPLPALAVPGFFGGVLFSIVLGIAGRRHRLDELSLPRFAAWGAVGGLLVGLIPATMVSVGLATFNDASSMSLWQMTAVISGPLIGLSAASASGSLILARRTKARELLRADGAEH
ncbi:MAG TPA: hypothetical protein VGM67_16405 [Gemmatimonadaceae bacterium]|jgi:NO-binding membrane sensor protein with MHYT domain